MRTSVIVRLQVDGMHNFPKAAELFPEVAFLAERHRHIFHIELKKEVFHDDRDVEFIMFKKDVTDFLKQMYYKPETRTHEFGPMSCEMIARQLLNQFSCVSATVWEDLENGAIVEA
jgi:hypothetical protein